MTAMGMQGARFIEGDPTGGVGDPAPKVDPKPAEGEPKPADNLGGFKSQESKDAVLADLTKAREDLKKFQDAEAEREKAKLSDIERAQADVQERDKRIAELEANSARLSALAKYPISEENRDLVTGTDAESFEASAKRISELEARTATPGTPKPDMSGGAKHEATGTVAEQIAAAEKSGDKSRVASLKAQQLGELASNLK
ncbi:hypothetical protein ACT3R5_16015 [Glutamicibacter sp. AOP5-A2-7]